MARKRPYAMYDRGTFRRGEVEITGKLIIGAAGALSSFECEYCDTTGIVKTAAKTGRYTVTFLRKLRNLRIGSLELVGPADVALTATDGNEFFARNVTGSGFDIQAIQTSKADANPASGSEIHFTVYGQEL